MSFRSSNNVESLYWYKGALFIRHHSDGTYSEVVGLKELDPGPYAPEGEMEYNPDKEDLEAMEKFRETYLDPSNAMTPAAKLLHIYSGD